MEALRICEKKKCPEQGGWLACLSSPEPAVCISSQLQWHHVGINQPRLEQSHHGNGQIPQMRFSAPCAPSYPTFTSLPLPVGYDLQGDISQSPEFTNIKGGHRRHQKLPEWLSCSLALSCGSRVHIEPSASWLWWGHRKTREDKTHSHNGPPRYSCQMKYRMLGSRQIPDQWHFLSIDMDHTIFNWCLLFLLAKSSKLIPRT